MRNWFRKPQDEPQRLFQQMTALSEKAAAGEVTEAELVKQSLPLLQQLIELINRDMAEVQKLAQTADKNGKQLGEIQQEHEAVDFMLVTMIEFLESRNLKREFDLFTACKIAASRGV